MNKEEKLVDYEHLTDEEKEEVEQLSDQITEGIEKVLNSIQEMTKYSKYSGAYNQLSENAQKRNDAITIIHITLEEMGYEDPKQQMHIASHLMNSAAIMSQKTPEELDEEAELKGLHLIGNDEEGKDGD